MSRTTHKTEHVTPGFVRPDMIDVTEDESVHERGGGFFEVTCRALNLHSEKIAVSVSLFPAT